jgi:hypothetical protein
LLDWLHTADNYIKNSNDRNDHGGPKIDCPCIIKQKNAYKDQESTFACIGDQELDVLEDFDVLILCSSEKQSKDIKIKGKSQVKSIHENYFGIIVHIPD